MFPDPLRQMTFFNDMSRIALSSTALSIEGTAKAMSSGFSALGSKPAKKKRGSNSKKKTASKTRAKAKPKKADSTKAATDLIESWSQRWAEMAFAPMKAMTDAIATSTKTDAFNPLQVWFSEFPFAKQFTAPAFNPFFGAANFPAPFSAFMPGFTPSTPSFMPFLNPMTQASGFAPWLKLDDLPIWTFWMNLFGLKRERTVFEKMTDPLDVSSNVVPFQSWSGKGGTSNPLSAPFGMPQFGADKIAAGLAAFAILPQFMQNAAPATPWWAAFGA